MRETQNSVLVVRIPHNFRRTVLRPLKYIFCADIVHRGQKLYPESSKWPCLNPENF